MADVKEQIYLTEQTTFFNNAPVTEGYGGLLPAVADRRGIVDKIRTHNSLLGRATPVVSWCNATDMNNGYLNINAPVNLEPETGWLDKDIAFACAFPLINYGFRIPLSFSINADWQGGASFIVECKIKVVGSFGTIGIHTYTSPVLAGGTTITHDWVQDWRAFKGSAQAEQPKIAMIVVKLSNAVGTATNARLNAIIIKNQQLSGVVNATDTDIAQGYFFIDEERGQAYKPLTVGLVRDLHENQKALHTSLRQTVVNYFDPCRTIYALPSATPGNLPTPLVPEQYWVVNQHHFESSVINAPNKQRRFLFFLAAADLSATEPTLPFWVKITVGAGTGGLATDTSFEYEINNTSANYMNYEYGGDGNPTNYEYLETSKEGDLLFTVAVRGLGRLHAYTIIEVIDEL